MHFLLLLFSYVLDQILSGAPLDEVIDKVQTFLQALADDVATDVVPMPDFYITKVNYLFIFVHIFSGIL